MGKKFFFLLILGILVTALAYAFLNLRQSNSIAGYMKKWGVRADIAEFALTDFSRDNTKTIAKEELAAKRGETTLKLTNVKAEAPQKYIDDKTFLLESLFLPTTSPYPGVITNVIECPPEFHPSSVETKTGTVYTLFAGERFNYGVCAQDLVAYYSAYGIFDCGEKGVFEVRVFSKDEQGPKTIVHSFAC